MASRKLKEFRARLVSENDDKIPCIFCNREIDDEVIFGKLYAIGDVQCHYFCALLSCCLMQKGKDTEGLFGFLYKDILAEVERCKKHKCSYCGHMGANLGCTVSQCRKQFHLPCGRQKNAVTLFYGNFKSYCQQHAPKQRINKGIMAKARLRMPKRSKNKKYIHNVAVNLEDVKKSGDDFESVCVICYEEVETYPTVNTFWPPCCGKDAWFHRSCLQRMALSAGMHYLKCPLCNDKDNFYKAVLEQGYYVPDRDAAWELEENAFQEIYSRVLTCSAEDCKCPKGRNYDADTGIWELCPCALCGAISCHTECRNDRTITENVGNSITNNGDHTMSDNGQTISDNIGHTISDIGHTVSDNSGQTISENGHTISDNSGQATDNNSRPFVCDTCTNAAKEDLTVLLERVASLVVQEQARAEANNSRARQPVMPSRMSLRRTKQRVGPMPSTSGSVPNSSTTTQLQNKDSSQTDTAMSRQELNLKTPKRKSILNQIPINSIDNSLLSPLKLLEQGLNDKMSQMSEGVLLNCNSVIELMRQKFRKPKPLSEKRKIINEMIELLLNNHLKELSPKCKEPMRVWVSPKKCLENYNDKYQNPEKVNKNKTPIKSETKSQIIEIKEEPITLPNTILRNLLNEIDNRKNSPIEHLFNKVNSIIGTKQNINVNKEIKIEVEDSENVNNNLEKNVVERDIEELKVASEKRFSKSNHKDFNDVKDETEPKSIIVNNVPVHETPKKTINDEPKDLNKKNNSDNAKCALKFSNTDKEKLWSKNFDINLEDFKNKYLNEVCDKMCSFKHKHTEAFSPSRLRTAIDFARDAAKIAKEGDSENKSLKRKLEISESDLPKKKTRSDQDSVRITRSKCKNNKKKNRSKDKEKTKRFSAESARDSEKRAKKPKKGKTKSYSETPKRNSYFSETNDENIMVEYSRKKKDKKQRKKQKSNKKAQMSIQNQNLKVKIQWKKEKIKLKISNSIDKVAEPKMTQYVLHYSQDGKDVLARPDKNMTPTKKKNKKVKKTPDNLKQMSIQNFFSVKPSP